MLDGGLKMSQFCGKNTLRVLLKRGVVMRPLFFFLENLGWTLGVPMGKSARNKKLSEAVESLHDKWFSEVQNPHLFMIQCQ